ncbi:protein-L-isoaspartate(D-aspartate) O-methyltransferase [Halopiger xanaduensis]|uniref:Protein-L-isoaspartate O-methyltransferase n=1 Tax=Halopiger xanaduensis (strain DSM 18323 / JCM 14033 / SH-6) TaxID=797210 RepID=F8D426_HALXS|nr:protein-L-isoaspartate(D-aspartate) O-methyltransferase [Halopiger xanaduensis]AEH36282.1 Protein-L-isoaspartate O-methyltransferase [Halopiger xanaduensis SH-6]
MFDRFRSSADGDADSDDGEYEAARERMVRTVAHRVADDRVLEALEDVPRHEFVPPDRRGEAYADRPLPIGDGQTISAPHMVAVMADRLDLEPGDEVLEIGTGCGYHAAVTAEIVGPENVYSVEYGEQLAEQARARLEEIGYGEIDVRIGDGRNGWAEQAPYDAAYFTCATAELPEPVVEQVRPGGRILAPVGTGRQTLVQADKRADGSLERTEHGGVRFVQMRG